MSSQELSKSQLQSNEKQPLLNKWKSNDDLIISKRQFYGLLLFMFVGAIFVIISITLDSPQNKTLKSSNNKNVQKYTNTKPNWPIIISTWTNDKFKAAVETGWNKMNELNDSLSGVVFAGSYCESNQCDGSVGYGNKPDASGEVTLDAMVMYGPTHDAGAVVYLREIKQAIKLARYVMYYTDHTTLGGMGASSLGAMVNLTQQSLSTNESIAAFNSWVEDSCQPNHYQNFYDENTSCPEYTYKPFDPLYFQKMAFERINTEKNEKSQKINSKNVNSNNFKAKSVEYDHDTMGIIAIDKYGFMSVGCTTNGISHKVPGRVADSSLIGSGAYVMQGVGGCTATQDGDTMQKFVPSFSAVKYMERGFNPTEAAKLAILEIYKYYPTKAAALVCMDQYGNYGAYAMNSDITYSIRDSSMNYTQGGEGERLNTTKL